MADSASSAMAAWLRVRHGFTVFVLTHESPDGDAIGSLLAMAQLLELVGATPVRLCPDPVPATYAFLPGTEAVHREPPAGVPADAHVFVDCASRERVGPLQAALRPGLPEANIDHHGTNTRFAATNWVSTVHCSTGEMVAELYRELGHSPAGEAPALYTAVVTDTGSFGFEGTTSGAHRLAAEFIEAGLDPAEFQMRLFEARDPAAVALLGRALGSLRLVEGGLIAYMTLGAADFELLGARHEHTEGLVNYARGIRGVAVGLLFYSTDGRQVRVAIRTRPGVDAALLASRFGGGGHPRAAACRMASSIEEAVRAVLAEARGLLPR